MTHDRLSKLIHARPFRPCRLKTAGGREFAVTQAEAIAYARERTAVVVPLGDRWEIIDIGLVESVEGTNEPAPAAEERDEER
jgi:hypothetical protein